jgi:hypothetical protein
MAHFDGAILLQTRLLPRIQSTASLPFSTKRRLPSKQELEEFLSFLSILALSNGLRYDPTVPEEHLSPSLTAAKDLGLSDLKPVGTTVGVDFVNDMKAAFAMATNRVDEVLDKELSRGHSPLDEKSVNGFVSALREMRETDDTEARVEIALNSFNKGQTGGKLLVGLAVEEHDQYLGRIADAAESQDPTAVMSSMINLFRPFLLSSWAGRHGAAFAGPPAAVEQVAAHQYAFWERLEREFVKRGNLKIPTYQQQLVSLPMIGVVILMMAPSTARPSDLINFAVEARRDLAVNEIAEVFWDIQMQAPKRDPKDVLKEAVEDLWGRIRKRGGPSQGEALKSFFEEVVSALSPALGIGSATAVATILARGDLTQASAALAAGFLSTAIFEVLRLAGRSDPPAAALSNLIALHQDTLHLIDRQVRAVWRTTGPIK